MTSTPLNALLTLSHDCRRPELFQPQVFAALELYEQGNFDPATSKGAWAGEIGMVQMLPGDIIEATVSTAMATGWWTCAARPADALMSGANMLKRLGWRAGEPWLQEVLVPSNLDWSKTGLDTDEERFGMGQAGRQGALGQPGAGEPQGLDAVAAGAQGPGLHRLPEFHRVYFEWNQSFVYVTTAAYFATRLEGAPVFDAGNPEAGLSGAQMKQLQQKLQARGYDVGKIDGILGARTRAAVQKEQARLGLPADAWPTAALLNAL